MAMECDLEDFQNYCEGKVEVATDADAVTKEVVGVLEEDNEEWCSDEERNINEEQEMMMQQIMKVLREGTRIQSWTIVAPASDGALHKLGW